MILEKSHFLFLARRKIFYTSARPAQPGQLCGFFHTVHYKGTVRTCYFADKLSFPAGNPHTGRINID